MNKYKIKTKIGDTIKRIEINIHAGHNVETASGYHKQGVHVEERKIVYQTVYKIALNDKFITTIDRQRIDQKKDSYYTYLDQCIISVITKEKYFPNGVFGLIYTTLDSDIAIKKLSQAMQRKIDKEYGWLSNVNVYAFVENNEI